MRDVHSDEVRAPALRLEGFEGEWKATALSDIARKVDRKDSTDDSPVMMISAADGFINQSERYSSNNAGKSLKDYTVLNQGELAYNHGASKLRPFGSTFALKVPSARVPFVYHCFSTPDDNPYFVEVGLNSDEVSLQLGKLISSGARMDGLLNISFNEFLTVSINLPPRAVQDQLVNIFDSFDQVISLTSTRFSSLTSLKKTMLVKMFPRGTASTPEVRFEGFEGDWKRAELGQVVESFRYGVNAAAVPYDGATKYLRITDIDPGAGEFGTGEVTSPDVDRRTADDFLLEDGDLVFARTGATVGRSYLYREGVGRTVWAGFLIRAKLVAGSDPDFISASVLTPGYWEYVRMTSQRSGQPGLNSTEYARLPLWLPSLPEQQAIGAYFRSLDALIEAEQKKLDTLRNLKSALLTQMFV